MSPDRRVAACRGLAYRDLGAAAAPLLHEPLELVRNPRSLEPVSVESGDGRTSPVVETRVTRSGHPARPHDDRAGAVGESRFQMKRENFEELIESVREGARILRGEAEPSREFSFTPEDVQSIRKKLKKSQDEFALMLG